MRSLAVYHSFMNFRTVGLFRSDTLPFESMVLAMRLNVLMFRLALSSRIYFLLLETPIVTLRSSCAPKHVIWQRVFRSASEFKVRNWLSAGVTYLRYTVLTSSNKSETAVHSCDPALSVLVMLVSRNVFPVVSALQSVLPLENQAAPTKQSKRDPGTSRGSVQNFRKTPPPFYMGVVLSSVKYKRCCITMRMSAEPRFPSSYLFLQRRTMPSPSSIARWQIEFLDFKNAIYIVLGISAGRVPTSKHWHSCAPRKN